MRAAEDSFSPPRKTQKMSFLEPSGFLESIVSTKPEYTKEFVIQTMNNMYRPLLQRSKNRSSVSPTQDINMAAGLPKFLVQLAILSPPPSYSSSSAIRMHSVQPQWYTQSLCSQNLISAGSWSPGSRAYTASILPLISWVMLASYRTGSSGLRLSSETWELS